MCDAKAQPGSSLPDAMPQPWVEQIKKVVKGESPRLWVVLLGSSLVATIIGSPFSYSITERNISATKDLEATKTRLGLRKELVQSRVAAYGKLASALSTLEARLNTVNALSQLARAYRRTETTTAQIRDAIRMVGLAE